jgi:hypothetical protein
MKIFIHCIGHDSFKQVAGNTNEKNRPVVSCDFSETFFKNWNNYGQSPWVRYITSKELLLEDYDQSRCKSNNQKSVKKRQAGDQDQQLSWMSYAVLLAQNACRK